MKTLTLRRDDFKVFPDGSSFFDNLLLWLGVSGLIQNVHEVQLDGDPKGLNIILHDEEGGKL